jgi:hypothetical protein
MEYSYQTWSVLAVTGVRIPRNTIREVLKMEYSDVSFKNVTMGKIYFLSQIRTQLICYVKNNCFHITKFDNHNNENSTNIKSRNSETVAYLLKVYLNGLFQIISPTITFNIILEL